MIFDFLVKVAKVLEVTINYQLSPVITNEPPSEVAHCEGCKKEKGFSLKKMHCVATFGLAIIFSLVSRHKHILHLHHDGWFVLNLMLHDLPRDF